MIATPQYQVWLVRLGNVPPVERAVCDALRAALPCEAAVSAHRLDTDFAFDEARGQLSSTLLLERLADLAETPADRILGITSTDLFIPVLTFVFGEAYLGGASAVISTHRLDPNFYGLPHDIEVMQQRAGVEAVHEIGHTLGLVHCMDYGCVMHASHTADEIDLKPARYCTACARRICGG